MVDLKVPSIEKLLDYAASGIGAIAGPMLAPWRAYREGQARINAANADAEVRRIEAESDARALQIIADAQVEARQSIDTPIESGRGMMEITRSDITQRIEFQERKRLANVRSVVESAAAELGDKEVPDHDPDPDWTARFFDCVQDVSSEEMQRLWARLLSGEVQRPGGTSLRTLETLRNLSKTDAEVFSNACSFVFMPFEVSWGFVLRGDECEKKFDAIHYAKLLHLQDCGLLIIEQTVCTVDSNSMLEYQNLLLKVSKNTNSNFKFEFSIATLTTAGTELYRIVQPKLRMDMDYLRCFASLIKSNGCQLSSAQIVNRLPDGKSECRNNFIPIEPDSDQPDGLTP